MGGFPGAPEREDMFPRPVRPAALGGGARGGGGGGANRRASSAHRS